jgi:hypothetical protein
MNVASHEYVGEETPSQDYEINYDEENLDTEEEGFLDATPKGRSANYTVAEDKLLCLAWKKVGLDAAVGVEQNKDTYWKRMWEFFVARNKSGNERTSASIHHRWSTIFMDCQKLSACLAHVARINPSGTNDLDRVSVGKETNDVRIWRRLHGCHGWIQRWHEWIHGWIRWWHG